jgi:DnaJ family protein C protein 28
MNSIEEQIREAIAAGKFSNLRGKGKPLPLEEDPYEDPNWRLAYHLLHENGYSLPWIEARREIEAELEASRQALRKAWQRWVSVRRADEWNAARSAFIDQVESLNQRILTLNLQVPNPTLQLPRINLAQELDQLEKPDSPEPRGS